MPPDAPIAPHSRTERHELIDALRGFALAGVLLANLSTFSLYQYLNEKAQAALPTAGFDKVVNVALQLLLTHKAVTVFSILFGLGFAMQLERAQARGADGLRVFLRRMTVLLAIGVLHSAYWFGDILLIYAAAGFALILFRKWPDRWLVWGGFLIALGATAALRPALIASMGAYMPREQFNAAVLQGLLSPSWEASLGANIESIRRWYPIGGLWLVCFALGRFLLGYWAGRRRLLQEPEAHRPLLKRILAWTLPLGAIATGLQFAQASIKQAVPMLAEGPGAIAWSVIGYAGPLLLGIAFGIVFVLLFLHEGWKRWLRHFAPAGRMALTNYLMQTAVCTGVFYGIGLGIGPKFGTASWLVLWVLLFGAQMVVSRWWLARYRFGPMEWLWRTLTYGRLQPMRPATATDQPATSA
ncbi:DUF418 domain-containing protein [Luteimonas panaciterrae]|uniref:DUF418 domain-containing protein n=1 Tax=Luteimonas panaciterrae TaxID=363885 RepID=UPI001CFA8D1F|nr:DUF418 domain-containing protein [Luteimonas panaciterrae]